MENEKITALNTLEDLTIKIKSIAFDELNSAFSREIKAYAYFIKTYREILNLYSADISLFQTDKNSVAFLNKTVVLYTQLSEALSRSFDEKEPVLFPAALHAIAQKSIELIADQSHTEKSFVFDLLSSTREKQESQRSKIRRLGIKITKALRPKWKLEDKDTLNLIASTFFDQSIDAVLKEKETEILAFYYQLSVLTKDIWNEFDQNIAFLKQLDKANYLAENIGSDSSNFDWSASNKFDSIANDFQNFVKDLTETLEQTIHQYDFASLILQKDKPLSLIKIKKTQSTYYRKIEKQIVLWRKTRLVLIEDWLLDLEIFRLKYQIIPKYMEFTRVLNENFSVPLNKEIDAFELQFGLLIDYFEKSAEFNSEKEVHASLKDLKLQLKKELLDKSLPSLRKQLNNSRLIEEIDAFESFSEKSFASLSETRKLMKVPDYSREVRPEEIESISPLGLISFEIKPAFILVFAAFKRALISHIQSLLNQLETAPNIAIYSIESAAKLYDENKLVPEIRKICTEGIIRSQIKVSETKSLNDAFIQIESEKLRTAIDTLVISVIEITNNESALQIKIRIVRAKALLRSKEIQRQIIKKALNLLPILIVKAKLLYRFTQESARKIAKQFALDKTQTFITTSISHFLATVQLSISELPYIYRRLFSFEPLDTFELYIERDQPMKEMESAFKSWKQEKFSPVVLIGERGSGKTTFIHKFIQSKASNEKIVLIDLLAKHNRANVNFQQIIDLVHHKNKQVEEKKIVIIDGFERLFESKINGFDLLLGLFKIISDTQKEIFWIVSVHGPSWNYFDKSIDASNYFGYHIQLNNLTNNELISLIESRHNLSGYKIVFDDKPRKKSLLGNKNYDNLDPQVELRKNFFNDLNKSVQGNILQAYIYWLRSARLSENNTIRIQTDNQLDFDFVRGIPHRKLHILKSILIHNGLTVETLADSFRISKSKSELELKQLFDDGILSMKNEVYYINALIYKQLIKHLNDINLLH